MLTPLDMQRGYWIPLWLQLQAELPNMAGNILVSFVRAIAGLNCLAISLPLASQSLGAPMTVEKGDMSLRKEVQIPETGR